MVVIITESVPPSLNGQLRRWMIEPKSGVFIGRLSGRVRDRLWDRVQRQIGEGSALLLHPTDNEQGFLVRVTGSTSRELVDCDGLQLFRRLTTETT